jgi:hypothetical protein
VCQEEAWFDSLSILGSDSDEDFISVNGGLYFFQLSLLFLLQILLSHFFRDHIFRLFFLADLPAMSNSAATQLMQCEDDSSISDAFQKFERIFDGSSVAQAVGQYLKDANKTDRSRRADMQESGRPKGANLEPCDVSNGMEEAKTRNEGIKILTKHRKGEDACNTLKSVKDGEKVNDSIFKSLTPVCTPRQANSKVQPLAVASPRGQKKKSAVVRLSFKRQSFDGDPTTAICMFCMDFVFNLSCIRLVYPGLRDIVGVEYLTAGSSRRYLIRPRAGSLVPQANEKISEGCWSLLEPSTFKLRGENFFK